MDDSTLVRQTRCPICANEGRDRSGNNLAVYSDGHSYCYGGHGIISGGDKVYQFKHRDTPVLVHDAVVLPPDCDTEYPQRTLDWVGQYELTRNDLLSHGVLWSEYNQRLIFPVVDSEQGVIAWQGRWFGEGDKVKWFGRGNLKDTFNLLGKGDKLILTEDVVSAIKVSNCGVIAMPLYGCFVGISRLTILRKSYGYDYKVQIWLDPDKRKEAVREARRGQFTGLDSTPIFSSKDPKEHSYAEIKEILE